ncbi:hypothetical protein AWH56_017950 [Anaerobacillus isosaccharinicus]|uniref:Uncharacterized protein n=1 Tax=Anaerobacillus isosaccharinicus TaxID=1532552 RepID=A0A7S7RA86_9BACI
MKKEKEDKQAEELLKKLDNLEQLLLKLNGKEFVYSITIEKLDIQNPALENLTFRLDNIDIDELSGALNLGNNIGVRVNQEKSKVKNTNTTETKKHEKKASVKTNEKGFTVSLNKNGG